MAALLLFACFGLCGPLSAAAKPPPDSRIVAVGDLHGDYSAWIDIARDAGLVDAQGHWSGGRTTLVQLGDILDRGPDSLKIVRHLQQLQAEAPRAGGKVVVVLGNHEAMNLLGDFRYTTAGEYAAFADNRSPARREQLYMALRPKLEAAARAGNPAALPSDVRARWLAQTPLGWVEHRDAWSPSGELGRWAARNPAIARIGDVLFVHGGISAEYAKLSIDAINRRVAGAMAHGDDSATSVLTDPLGPLWYRGLVGHDADAEAQRATAKPQAPSPTPEDELGTVLSAYGARHLVIAHTPNPKGIVIIDGGRLARIDTGISRFYGGVLGWLEIARGQMIPHVARRSSP